MDSPLYEDDDLSEIVPGVFLSNGSTSWNFNLLQQKGIRQILTVAEELNPRHRVGFRSETLPIKDDPDFPIAGYFYDASMFISNGPTLVHCMAGISRSPTIVMAHLMRTQHMSFQEAYDFVRSKRKCCSPNIGFILQLKDYETELS